MVYANRVLTSLSTYSSQSIKSGLLGYCNRDDLPRKRNGHLYSSYVGGRGTKTVVILYTHTLINPLTHDKSSNLYF